MGELSKIDPDLIVTDENLSLLDGAIYANGWVSPTMSESMAGMYYRGLANHYKFDLNTPFKDLSDEVKDAILFGTKGVKIKLDYERSYGSGSYYAPFEGVCNNLERRYRETGSDFAKYALEKFVNTVTCPKCHGARLNDEMLAVTVG